MRTRLILILTLLCLSGCQNASQLLVPGGLDANKTNSGDDKTTSEGTTPSPVSAPPEAAGNPPPAGGDTSQKIAQQVPTIEPKNDTILLPMMLPYTEERLRYDSEHPIELPKEGAKEGTEDLNVKLLLEGYAPGTPRQGADENDPESFWHTFMDGDPVSRVQIRLIYLPAGKTEADAKYCDTFVNNETLKTEGTNVSFSKLKIGPGIVRFFDVVTAGGCDSTDHTFLPPTPDFHDHGWKDFKNASAYQDFVSNTTHRELPLVPFKTSVSQ